MPTLCMILSFVLIILSLGYLAMGSSTYTLAGSIFMVAATICLLASVTASKAGKPVRPESSDTSRNGD